MRQIATIIMLFISFNSFAAETKTMPSFVSKYIQGIDYQLLANPVRTITGDKIEVTEAFSYVCGHCYTFEPTLEKWHRAIAPDVQLVKLPVVFQPSMEHYARIMYTAKSLKIQDKASAATFKAIHIQKKRLKNEKAVSALFESLGVAPDEFKKTFNSFGVNMQVKQASARTRAFKITGTPQMIVDGRYSVSVTRETGHAGMLKVVDFLISKVRAEKK